MGGWNRRWGGYGGRDRESELREKDAQQTGNTVLYDCDSGDSADVPSFYNLDFS